jgi:hypothetical protein
MYHSAASRPSVIPTRSFPTHPFADMAAQLQAWLDAWRERRRRAAAQREFERLDAATLRDLGLHAGEFGSFWAEAHGRAERTRRRSARR